MATLNQIVTILAERSGRQYDLVFKRELKTIVHYWRVQILKQTIQKKASQVSYFLNPIVIEIEQVPEIECPIKDGCVLRSKERLPKTLRTSTAPFFYVGDPKFKGLGFSFSQSFNLDFLKYSRNQPANVVRYTFIDGYLYFYNLPKSQRYVGVQDVFESPETLKTVNCDTGETKSCYSDDSEYPMTEDLVQQLIQAILSTELRIQVQSDTKEVPLNVEVNGRS